MPDEENANIAAMGIMKLPQFLPSDPELWFTQVDGLLHVNRITSDASMYYTVITALDADTLRQISDVAKNPPESAKYEKLKKELIARFSESKEKQITKLLTGIDLGNKKPSHLLREMRDLAGTDISDGALTTIFMQRMPSNVRCILSSCKKEELDNLAEIADRIIDNSQPSYMVASTYTTTGDENYCESITSKQYNVLDARISALETSINNVVQKLSELLANNSERRGSMDRSRNRSRSRQQNKSKVCYYHIKFGAASRKCQQPCEFNSNPTNKNPGN